MTDVFLRIYIPKDDFLRAGMAMSTEARWRMQVDARLKILRAWSGAPIAGFVPLPPEGFHIESKRKAEELAETPIYVVADDDCLILGKDFISKGVALLEANPDYGIVAATGMTGAQVDLDRRNPEELTESHAVGGVAFVRKGILREFKMCKPELVDGTIYDEMRGLGWKSGLLNNVKFNHLGCGYSLTSPWYWMA